MHRRGVLALPLMLAACGALCANTADGDPRKEKLFSMFIAPCCWRENLLVHHSPKADELRAEIEKLIGEGRHDNEIKQVFLDRYSMRILALPDGARGEWLAWTPAAMMAAGLLLLGAFIGRSLKRQEPILAAKVDGVLPDLPDSELL